MESVLAPELYLCTDGSDVREGEGVESRIIDPTDIAEFARALVEVIDGKYSEMRFYHKRDGDDNNITLWFGRTESIETVDYRVRRGYRCPHGCKSICKQARCMESFDQLLMVAVMSIYQELIQRKKTIGIIFGYTIYILRIRELVTNYPTIRREFAAQFQTDSSAQHDLTTVLGSISDPKHTYFKRMRDWYKPKYRGENYYRPAKETAAKDEWSIYKHSLSPVILLWESPPWKTYHLIKRIWQKTDPNTLTPVMFARAWTGVIQRTFHEMVYENDTNKEQVYMQRKRWNELIPYADYKIFTYHVEDSNWRESLSGVRLQQCNDSGFSTLQIILAALILIAPVLYNYRKTISVSVRFKHIFPRVKKIMTDWPHLITGSIDCLDCYFTEIAERGLNSGQSPYLGENYYGNDSLE